MDRIVDYFRSPSTGNGISGRTVSLRLHNGGSEIATTTTDANGRFEFGMSDVQFEGPVYYMVDDGSGTFKRHSGNSYGQIGPIWFDAMVKMFSALGRGVMSGYAVSADGSGMSVSVAAGIALTKDGIPVYSDAAQSVTIAAADGTNPRIDRIVLRTTRIGQTDEGKVELVAVTGTPAATPTAPSLTASSSADDITLAQVLVGAGAAVIAADKVTDERALAGQEVLSVPLALSTITEVTATADEVNVLDGITASTAELNTLDGITATVTELNHTDGVTSNIQTQLDAMMPIAGGTFTGNVAVQGGLSADDYLTATGNLNANGTANLNGNVNLGNSPSGDTTTVNSHFKITGGTFGATVGAAAGLGGSLAATRVRGSDQCGEVQVVTGAGSTATGTLATVNLSNARPSTDYQVFLQPMSINASDLNLSVTSRTTTSFDIRANTAPGAGETLVIGFLIIEV